MADIYSFPNNVDEFTGAESLMRWFHGRTSGIYGDEGNGAVTAVNGAMKVEVADANGWLTNSKGDGIAWWNITKQLTGSPLQLDIAAADGVLNRIDRVVVTWETTDYTTRPRMEILQGTPSSSPNPPALTNNNIKRQISLAKVSVPAGTIKITPNLITDERLDPSVCGIVSESLQADTSMLYAQITTMIADLKAKIEQAAAGALINGSVTPEKLSNSTKELFAPAYSFSTVDKVPGSPSTEPEGSICWIIPG